MNRQRQEQQFPVIGGSSLLVIFAVLCLTVFALLGFSTVQANKRLTDVSIQAVTDYYAADNEAEMILAQLRSGQIPEKVSVSDGVYSYRCTISPTQELCVAVRSGDWKVLRWQAVSTVYWQENDHIEVWSGKD